MISVDKAKIKKTAISQAKRFAVMLVYLWALFSVFEIHGAIILRQQLLSPDLSFKVGFAFVNALVLAKIMFLFEEFHLGERFRDKALVYVVLFKSAFLSAVLVCFHTLEEVVTGLFRGKTLAQIFPDTGAGTAEQLFSWGVIAFVVLIPFFAYTELQRVIGESELQSIFFTPPRETKAGAADGTGPEQKQVA